MMITLLRQFDKHYVTLGNIESIAANPEAVLAKC
jgi:hypothetical protein